MDGHNTCTHRFLRGAKMGTVCDETVVMDDRCQDHLILDAPVPTLGEHGTCNWKFTKGVREGKYCPGFALEADGPCEIHVRITDDTAAGRTHCSHKYTGGERKDCYCTSPPDIDGMCWNHHMATSALDQPQGSTDEEYFETCKYQFTSGKRANKYCPHKASDSGYCHAHRNGPKTLKKKSSKTPQAPVPKTRCEYVMRAGPRTGVECGKVADNRTHLCRAHARFAGKCTHLEKVVKVKYVPCSSPATIGTVCGKHHHE